jgi:diguanylate cyclase (GGDEF)-like protein/PAS domain S-box-containing protein
MVDKTDGRLSGSIGIITDISDLRHKEKDLLLTRIALDSTSNAVLLTDLNNKYVLYQNEAFHKLSGYTAAEINLAGGAKALYDRPEIAAEAYSTIIRGQPWKGDFDLKTNYGRLVPVQLHTSLVMSGEKAIGCFGVFTDMTERRLLEEERREAFRRLQSIIEFLPDATLVIDEENRVIAWNHAIEEMTGVLKEDMLGRSDYSLCFYGNQRPLLIDMLFNNTDVEDYDMVVRKENSLVGEAYSPHVFQGRGAYLWGTASLLYDSRGKITGAIESIRDMTERKKTADQLRRHGLIDALTGLYNRSYFQENISRPVKFRSAGIIVCDVDGLKLVNDTLGHDKGDAMLFAAAGVIKRCFSRKDIVARIGGDEFAVLTYDTTERDAEEACGRIREAVIQHNLNNESMPLSLSIGYAVTDDTSDIKALFKQADNNMYREKLHSSHSGRSTIVQTMMNTLKERDLITENHADRLQELVIALARAISLPESKIPDLRLLAQFHDIGKVGIPDSILSKPGPLTKKEFNEMKRHSEIGYRIAIASNDLAPIAGWILKHHEWWDGSGYPFGLKGEEIPLECRLISIADAYDAMTSDRPYRKALSHEEAIAELKKFSGRQFVPELVEIFIDLFT